MAEMGARLEELAHGEIWQCHEKLLLFRLAKREE
jgi:hypothetical protein